MRFPVLRALVVALISLSSALRADPPAPAGILDPKNAAQAWNAIRLATRNVEQLIAEDRLAEIPVQVSYCSPALRALARSVTDGAAVAHVQQQSTRAIGWLGAIARAAQENNALSVKENYGKLRFLLDDIARSFDPATLSAEIFFCPMHPDTLSEDANTPCDKCGSKLLQRRLPYSFIYTKPGEPTIRMTATADGPANAGRKLTVKVRLERADKSPVLPKDLIETHTQPIHLLIEEPALGDYHRVHPAPTNVPGEYEFSFTPKKSAPYRIWADLMPAATGVQELPSADLPGAEKAEAIADTATRLVAEAGGCKFQLTLSGDPNVPLRTREARGMKITVADADGMPFTRLEPVMNAFAHVVGFYDDYRTIIHLHSEGGEVRGTEARGGPAMNFVVFPPRAGFLRLYCQVSIGGKALFVPFNVNVAP